jgi:serine O-acetyltransferase
MGSATRALRALIGAVRDDHAMMRHYDEKYAAGLHREGSSLGRDLVSRVGFQMLAAYRLMRFCVEAKIPLAPRVASRLIRHVYGPDIHWEAEIDPGVVIVHGMGMAISRSARVRRGAILFQHVTLGVGTHPMSHEVGAPIVEEEVHVGAGSTLVGPIAVGARSKITGNCFVRTSVPPDSLVEAAPPTVSARRSHADRARSNFES